MKTKLLLIAFLNFISPQVYARNITLFIDQSHVQKYVQSSQGLKNIILSKGYSLVNNIDDAEAVLTLDTIKVDTFDGLVLNNGGISRYFSGSQISNEDLFRKVCITRSGRIEDDRSLYINFHNHNEAPNVIDEVSGDAYHLYNSIYLKGSEGSISYECNYTLSQIIQWKFKIYYKNGYVLQNDNTYTNTSRIPDPKREIHRDKLLKARNNSHYIRLQRRFKDFKYNDQEANSFIVSILNDIQKAR